MNDRYDFDVLVECPVCDAAINQPCNTGDLTVHLGRRIMALLKERGATLHDLERALSERKPLGGKN
jgi:hypothetical protein